MEVHLAVVESLVAEYPVSAALTWKQQTAMEQASHNYTKLLGRRFSSFECIAYSEAVRLLFKM